MRFTDKETVTDVELPACFRPTKKTWLRDSRYVKKRIMVRSKGGRFYCLPVFLKKPANNKRAYLNYSGSEVGITHYLPTNSNFTQKVHIYVAVFA